MPKRKKMEDGVVVPETKNYARDKKPKKHNRKSYIDSKGKAVSPDVRSEGVLPQQARKDVYSFCWRPDNMTMQMITELCDIWDCDRHECLRRLVNPIQREYQIVKLANRGKIKNLIDVFSLSYLWEFTRSKWPSWRRR